MVTQTEEQEMAFVDTMREYEDRWVAIVESGGTETIVAVEEMLSKLWMMPKRKDLKTPSSSEFHHSIRLSFLNVAIYNGRVN